MLNAGRFTFAMADEFVAKITAAPRAVPRAGPQAVPRAVPRASCPVPRTSCLVVSGV